MAWTQALSVGNALIDADHRHLFDIVNRLHDRLAAQDNQVNIDEILVELSNYTSYHFSREEFIMTRINYPFIENHMIEHQKLIQELAQLIFDYEKGVATIKVETLEFIKTWLLHHTSESDLRLATYIRTVHGPA